MWRWRGAPAPISCCCCWAGGRCLAAGASNFSHLIDGFGSPCARQSTLSSWFRLTTISLAGSLIHCSLTVSPNTSEPQRSPESRAVRLGRHIGALRVRVEMEMEYD